MKSLSFRNAIRLARCAALTILAALLLSGCAQSPNPSGGSSSGPSAPSVSVPSAPAPSAPAPAPAKPKPSEPFVTWDQKTTIPFLQYAVDQSEGPESRAFLGLWDLAKGTISFQKDALFSIDRQKSFAVWDGGDRFAFSHSSVTQLDPRIRVDCVTEGTYYTYLIAAPSGSDATFAVYASQTPGQIPALEIRNHPLAGTVVLDPPELPPGTRLWRRVGIEVSQDRVNVYFETSRTDVDPSSGKTTYGLQGVIQATYHPASAARPVTWRVVNPEVPSYIAGSGTRYAQLQNGLALSREYDITDVLDLKTGAVAKFPGLEAVLREIDPPEKSDGVRDSCYAYRDLRIVRVRRARKDGSAVNHLLAFRGDTLVGRIDMENGRLKVFKDGKPTCDIENPWPNSWLDFPQTVQAAGEPTAVPMDAYKAVWQNARYADLFSEPMRADGAYTEQIAAILMARFTADPSVFMRALGVAPANQIDRVGDLLAYNAGYGGLAALRAKVQGLRSTLADALKTGASRQSDVDAADRLLTRIAEFEKRK